MPRVGLHVTDVTTLHAPAGTGFHITAGSGEELRVDRRLPSLQTRMRLGPVNGAATLNWTLTEPGMNLTTVASLSTASLDTVKGSSQLAVRLEGVPAGETSVGTNATRVHVTPPTGTSLGRAFLAHRGDAPTNDLQHINLLGPQEGVVWATNPMKEGEGTAPAREGLTVNISNVMSLEVLRDVGSMTVQTERTSLAPTVPARFVSIADDTTADVHMTMGEHLDTVLAHDGNLTLAHDTDITTPEARFKLKAPQGFLELTATQAGDLVLSITHGSQHGSLTGSADDVRMQSTGDYGAVDATVEGYPDSTMTWSASDIQENGSMAFESGTATHVDAVIAPSEGVQHTAMHQWACEVDACVIVDTSRNPTIRQIDVPYLKSVDWSLGKLGEPMITLERGALATGSANLTLYDGGQTLYARSSDLAEDVHLRVQDPLARTDQAATGNTANPRVTYDANEAKELRVAYRHDGRFVTLDAGTAPGTWSVTEGGSSVGNTYELTWSASGSTSNGVLLQSNLHPNAATRLQADTAPPGFTTRVVPGNCGSTTPQPFHVTLDPQGGDFLGLNWTTTQDGTAPQEYDGLHARCEDGEGTVRGVLEKVVDVPDVASVEVLKARCVGEFRVPATSTRATPYAAVAGGGVVTGKVRLDSGSDVVYVFAGPKNWRNTQGPLQLKYDMMTSSSTIDKWSIAYEAAEPRDNAKHCLTMGKRNVQQINLHTENMPTKFTTVWDKPVVRLSASGEVGHVGGKVQVGPPVHEGVPELEELVVDARNQRVGLLDIEILDRESTKDVNGVPDFRGGNQFILVDKPEELYYVRARVQLVDDFHLVFQKDGCRAEVDLDYDGWDGENSKLNYWKQTADYRERILVRTLPDLLEARLTLDHGDIDGEIANSGNVDHLWKWSKGQKCGDTDGVFGLSKFVHLEDIPGDRSTWEIKLIPGLRTSDILLKPAGGPIGRAELGWTTTNQDKQDERYVSLGINNAYLRWQWDLDGHSDQPDNVRSNFIDTDGVVLSALTGRARFDGVGFGVGTYWLEFVNLQTRWVDLHDAVPVPNPLSVAIAGATKAGSTAAMFAYFEVFLGGEWWSMPTCHFVEGSQGCRT